MQEILTFKVDCEWLCNFVRQRVFYEGLPFTDGLRLLKETFVTDDATALLILTGAKKVVGINGGDLVDDNKQQEYIDYIARTEKKTRFDQLQADVNLHPYSYMDPFATRWSYKQFEEERKGNPSFAELLAYFGKAPAEGTITDGGLYSIDADFIIGLGITEKIVNDDDKTNFYEKLYSYWEKKLEEGTLDSYDEALVKRRQQVYRAYKRKEEYRQRADIAWMTGQASKKKKGPDWVISKSNAYSFCKSEEAGMYQSRAKFIPCDEGVFYEYGAISPTGDFYACDFAGHESMAVVLAYQNGFFKDKIPEDEDNPILYLLCSDDDDGIEFRHKAKDILYDRGWVFVNTAWGHGGTFYSKYGEIEDMPQKVMDTAYDYIVWEREGGANGY